jgi:CDP-glucose 4,6-dehydratase
MLNPYFWRGKRVFVTGHTGFKGSWLCLWLHQMGAEVSGFAMDPPSDPSLFVDARVGELIHSVRGDVTNRSALREAMHEANPEILIHMAAQSLVRYSYEHPAETFATNVLGSVHALDVARELPGLRAAVMVTSDKCYENNEWVWGYRENETLGGHDPYSASKGCAELVVSAMRRSFYAQGAAVASGRAGNVIGGGDWARDRLVPDVMRSLLAGQPTLIRNPQATRPWQHVLEPLHGYLCLAQNLWEGGHAFAEAWNFGPGDDAERTVGWIIDELYRRWGVSMQWQHDLDRGPAESTFLKLDASKARTRLDWRPLLDLPTTLQWIVDWTRRYEKGDDSRDISIADIERFMARIGA